MLERASNVQFEFTVGLGQCWSLISAYWSCLGINLVKVAGALYVRENPCATGGAACARDRANANAGKNKSGGRKFDVMRHRDKSLRVADYLFNSKLNNN